MSIHPKKRLGQAFLAPGSLAENIVAKAGFLPTDRVLEVGPGLGALTVPLARAVDHVLAIEKDADLIPHLEKRLKEKALDNVTVVVADILDFQFEKAREILGGELKIIANLPYNISTPFLLKLLRNRELFARAILMFQKEFGERLIARPNTKTYGVMTLLVGYCARASVLLRASKSAFWPRPKVDSIVVELDFKNPYPGAERVSFDEFRKVVRAAFSQRRKTLVNALAASFPHLQRSEILNTLKGCGISPSRRAESLSLDDFLALTSSLGPSIHPPRP